MAFNFLYKSSHNVLADLASRILNDRTEWALPMSIFTKITKLFFVPDIDLFASQLNTKLDRYISWIPDPYCFEVDSFSVTWAEFSPYLFPPFSILNSPDRPGTSSSGCFSVMDNTTLVPDPSASPHFRDLSPSRSTTAVSALADHHYSASLSSDLDVGSGTDFQHTRETRDFLPETTNIISHGIRKRTAQGYKSNHKYWFQFAESRGFNPYIPSVKNLLEFFHRRHQNNVLPNSLLHYCSALKWVINSSAHLVLDNILVSRYISGLFNLFPAPPKLLKDIRDVNDVLAYWDRLPMSEDLPLMLLSQKTVILILISSMRRRGELLHMNIDNITYAPNSMTFPLDAYPKTYCLLNQ